MAMSDDNEHTGWSQPQTPSKRSVASIVRERNEAYDIHSGPHGYERIGFEIEGRVFWVGMSASYSDNKTWETDKALCEDMVWRWNAFNPITE